MGVSASQVDGDNQYKYKKPGAIAGVYVGRAFTEVVGLRIESYYMGKGAVLNEKLSDKSSIQVFKTSLHYIEMPFLLNFSIHPKISIAVGIAPSYLFYAKQTSYKTPVDGFRESLKTFDFQPVGQIDFYLTEHISANLRMGYSVFNLKKDNGLYKEDFHNNNIGLVIRYKIR